MVCEGFLVGGPCVCVLVRGAESLFLECSEVASSDLGCL